VKWVLPSGALNLYVSAPTGAAITMAAVRASASSFEVGALHTLFENRSLSGTPGNFDAAADGQRFVFVDELGQPTAAITLVVNWTAELKK